MVVVDVVVDVVHVESDASNEAVVPAARLTDTQHIRIVRVALIKPPILVVIVL